MTYNTNKIINQIESDSLRKIAQYLVEQGYTITYFGQAWSEVSVKWLYFDIILDIEALRSRFQLSPNIIEHENRDPKSGTERGIIDKETGEGLMGKLK